jgi:tetratricopeptide (TPR) repeat protein
MCHARRLSGRHVYGLAAAWSKSMTPHTMLSLSLLGAMCVGCANPNTLGRAQALVREHRESDAEALLRERLRQHPQDLEARRLLIRVLAFAGDVQGARAEVGELGRRMPQNDPAPYIELGHAFELAHRYDEALASYDDAGSVAPVRPDGPREGGMRCARWGEAGWARPRLEEAVRRGARDAETWHVLGLVRVRLGDLDAAEAAYRAGVASDPSRPESWLGLATVAIARGDAGQALDAYTQVLARRPRFAAAELGRAWALGRLGRTSDASRALDRAEELGAPAANIAKQRAALTAPAGAGAK